jgi:hypothetical protein
MVGALGAEDEIPLSLRVSSNEANIRDWSATGKEFCNTILSIAERDTIRFTNRSSAMGLQL